MYVIPYLRLQEFVCNGALGCDVCNMFHVVSYRPDRTLGLQELRITMCLQVTVVLIVCGPTVTEP